MVLIAIRNMPPRVIGKPNCERMVSLISATAKAQHISISHQLRVECRMVSGRSICPSRHSCWADGLHMNDWSLCLPRPRRSEDGDSRGRDTAQSRPLSVRALRLNQRPGNRPRQRAPLSVVRRPIAHTAASAVNTSSTRSSGCSRPHESRTRPSLIPSAARAAGGSRWCVVVAG